MFDFASKFDEVNAGIEPDVKNKILQSQTLFDDALSLLSGHTKSEVYDKGTNTRSLMVDAIFSLKEVCV